MRTAAMRHTAVAVGVLALAGCAANAPTATAPRSAASTSATVPSTSAPSAPSSRTPSSSGTAAAHPLAALPSASFEPSLITGAQVARFGSHLVRYDPDSGDAAYDAGASGDGSHSATSDFVTGTGGTCPALATSINSDTAFSTDPDDSASVGYDNTDTAQVPSELRDVEETIESYPTLDTTRELAALRATIAGCHHVLRSKSGDQVHVTLAQAPIGYGSSALAFRVGFTSDGLTVDSYYLAIVEGHNLLSLNASGLTAAQRTALLSTVWSDLGHSSGSV